MDNGVPTELIEMIFHFVIEDLIKDAINTPFCEQGSSPRFKSELCKIFTAYPRLLLLGQPTVSKLKLYCYLHQHRCTNMFVLANSATATIFQVKNQTLHVEFSNKPAETNVSFLDISPIKAEELPKIIYEFVKPKKNIHTLTLKADFDLEPLLPDPTFIKDNGWKWNRPVPPRRRH